MSTKAELILGPNEAFMQKPGNYVLCAVSGKKIPLDNLRYWDCDTQQTFFSPEEALVHAKAQYK